MAKPRTLQAFSRAWRRVGCVWRSTLLRQVVVVLGFYEAYRYTRALIMKPDDWDAAILRADRVMGLERQLHLAWELPVQHVFLRIPELVKAMDLYYFVCQFAVTGLFLLWLFYRDRVGFFLLRNSIILASLIGFVIFWRFPTAPPRLAEPGILDTLRQLSGIDIGHSPTSSLSNPVAALPSLHATWSLAVAFGLWRYLGGRRGRVLALLYPLSVATTIIATGNHYVFDVIAGDGVFLVGLWLALGVERLQRPAAARVKA